MRRPRRFARSIASTSPRSSAICASTSPDSVVPSTSASFAAASRIRPITWPPAAGEYVLRRKPPGKLLPSAHAVDREYRVITALGRTDVPVPRTYVLCEDDAVIGTAFYVMDCVHGRIFSDPALPGVTPAERTAMYDSMNDVLARLHTVDSAGGRPRPTTAARATISPPDPPLDAAVPRVGDRADRVDGAPDRVAARAHAGGRHHHARPRRLPAGQYHFPPDRAARGRRARLGAVDARPSAGRSRLLLRCPIAWAREWDGFRGKDLKALGIPSERTSWPTYCRRVGRPNIPDWDWYIVFACSAWPPSPRASWDGSLRAPRTIPTQEAAANAPNPWPTPAGRSSKTKSRRAPDEARARLSDHQRASLRACHWQRVLRRECSSGEARVSHRRSRRTLRQRRAGAGGWG